ncbi:hypothetical protein L1987_06932 [Smallanthus sonchifolius]|uniref:Uncharacterized protein n=1 Tax=Smallanthus sonchifolius TaxID=185202 RepID=A0ACB9JZN9_9ASTR|nr:hypothetical protein L1987_06932 [Smallanthus sonchifolius]
MGVLERKTICVNRSQILIPKSILDLQSWNDVDGWLDLGPLLTRMFQPPFEMENGHNVIKMSTVNDLQMIPFDDNDPEVIARRIKNRERQRRYRARKRQEADLKRASMINHPIQLPVDQTRVNDTPVNVVTHVSSQQVDLTKVNDTPVNILTRVCGETVDQTHVSDTPVNLVTRVYSQRKWKKDARTAHLLKQQNVASCTTSASIDLQPSGSQSNVIVDTREHSSTPSGRNWKAEARNKRN